MPADRSKGGSEARPSPITTTPGPLSQRARVAAAKLGKTQSEPILDSASASSIGTPAVPLGPPSKPNEQQGASNAGSSSQAITQGSRPLRRSKTLPAPRQSKRSDYSLLPRYIWNEGNPNLQRIFIEDSDELTYQLQHLLKDTNIVAFDMEWPWDQKAKEEGPVAVIQISSPSLVIVYGLPWENKISLHPEIVQLLESNVIKVGNNIGMDMQKLYADDSSLPDFKSLLDLSQIARYVDRVQWVWHEYPCIKLERLVGHYLNVYLGGKSDERFSDWTLRGDAMSQTQLDYASADVTVSLRLLDSLMNIRKEVDVTKLTFNTVLEDREVAAERRQKYYRAERLSS